MRSNSSSLRARYTSDLIYYPGCVSVPLRHHLSCVRAHFVGKWKANISLCVLRTPPLQVRIARKRHLNFAPTSLLHSHVNLVPTLGLFFDATMDPFKWRLCRSLHMFPNQRMKRPLNPAAKRGPSVGWEIENAKPYAEPTVQFGCAGNVRIS